jgi:hypothetical protein
MYFDFRKNDVLFYLYSVSVGKNVLENEVVDGVLSSRKPYSGAS